MMVEEREVDGHTVCVGMELDGPGKRVYIDGEDWTEAYLYRYGERRGLRELGRPRGTRYIVDQVALSIRAGEFGPGVDVEKSDKLTDSDGLLHRILNILR